MLNKLSWNLFLNNTPIVYYKYTFRDLIMKQTSQLIQQLKRSLKQSGKTYKAIATHLEMSEANVKRMFASENFSLKRLETICNLIQLTLTDLMQLVDESIHRINSLSLAQEEQLVSDSKLLLVAVSVKNYLSFEDIIHHYQISESECIQCLAKLDRLKIIDLLPNNRIKLLIDQNFKWIKNGPIEKFFQQQIQQQFLKSRFNDEQATRLFQFGLLGDTSSQIMLKKLRALALEFTDLHKQDQHLALDKKHSMGLLLATRPWDLDIFKPMLK